MPYKKSYIGRSRVAQQNARADFGLRRKNSLKPWKKRVMRSGITGKSVFKKRYNPTRFRNWLKYKVGK